MDYSCLKNISENTQLMFEAASLMRKYQFLIKLGKYIIKRTKNNEDFQITKAEAKELIGIFQKELLRTDLYREKLIVQVKQNTHNIDEIKESIDFLCSAREEFNTLNEIISKINFSTLNNSNDLCASLKDIKNYSLSKLSIKETKERFYQSLQNKLKEDEKFQQYKNKIENIEKKRIRNTIKTHYRVYEEHLNNPDGYENFDYYLNYIDYKQNYERDLFLCNIRELHINDINDTAYIVDKYTLLDSFCSKIDSIYNIDSDQTQDLAISIISEIDDELVFLEKSKKRLSILNDFLQIYSIFENGDLSKEYNNITIKFGEKKQIKLESKQLKSFLSDSIIDLSYLNKDKFISAKIIKDKIESIERYLKRSLHICIRRIALQLIRYNIISKKSFKGNKYELYSINGELLELRRIDAELIYDIADSIGLDIKKTKGDEKGMKALYYDKMDVIKERLETAVKYREYDLPLPTDPFVDMNY